MLDKIKMHNFLSYEDAEESFLDNSTTALVGDNGSGKSSFLEAIRFALYGDGRENPKSLSRIKSDDGMNVILTLKNVPNKKDVMEIERGVETTGKGYLKVTINDKVEAKGGAKSTNNPAQTFIDNYLGIDKDAFSLTSFFGLGESDNLMKVAPSERLETLQSVAKVDICQKFNKTAETKLKKVKEDLEKQQYALSKLKDYGEINVEDINKNIEEKETETERLRKVLEKLRKEKIGLEEEQERHQTLVRERDKLQEKRKFLLEKIKDIGENIDSSKKKIDRNKEISERLVNEKVILIKSVEGKDVKELETVVEDLKKKINMLEWNIELKNVAMKSSNTKIKNCPLCESEISQDKYTQWKSDIKEFKEKLEKLEINLPSHESKLNLYKRAVKNIDDAKRELKRIVDETDELNKELDTDSGFLVSTKSEYDRVEERYKKISKDVLNRLQIVIEEIKGIEEKVAKIYGKVNYMNGEISELKNKLKEGEGVKKEIEKLKRDISVNTKLAKAYSLVAEGFSRYAIPIELLTNLRLAIEKKSTRIYQYFDNGIIKIRDIEGDKPGLDFVLIDRKGERSYKRLSEGEKVMVFLPVRLAIAQIINSSRNNKINFLALDEITSHLSPQKIEDLVRLINKVLKKFFSQILIVSHVPLRNIFDKVLNVRSIDDISIIEEE